MKINPAVWLGLICAIAVTGCDSTERTTDTNGDKARAKSEDAALNLYIWNDYLAPDTISNFEKESGITVTETNFSSDEQLESKLAAGHSGYDIVVPSGSFYERQIQSGFYEKLDKSKLPNLVNMEPHIQRRMAIYDPNNDHAVLHTWGTDGIAYNVKKVRAALPDAVLDSWNLVFDPALAKELQGCGIAIPESASDMFPIALIYLNRNANSQIPADIEAAAGLLMKLRPHIRFIDSDRIIPGLANGEICVAVAYGGSAFQARARAQENGTGQKIAYFNPKEGSLMWFASFLIPKDAPHHSNAEVFLNYILRGDVMAAITNSVGYANGNGASNAFVRPDILHDPAIYPPMEVQDKLVSQRPDSEKITRLTMRLWTKFVTGR